MIAPLPGSATPGGTQAYARRVADRTAAGHFRALGELTLSSIGLGTYLGPADDATDAASEAAVARALPFARSAPGMGTARAG